MTDYPDSCLRGIRKAEFWINDNFVRGDAFEPDPRTDRGDGYIDTSIDWEDEEDTVNTMKRNPNSQHGIIRLQRKHIDELIVLNEELPGMRDSIQYERYPIDGNPSHGNLRFATSLPKPLRNMLTTQLAYRATAVLNPTRK